MGLSLFTKLLEVLVPCSGQDGSLSAQVARFCCDTIHPDLICPVVFASWDAEEVELTGD